jgi:spore coat protein A, manganese oxidase
MTYRLRSRRQFLQTGLAASASLWYSPSPAHAATRPLNPRELQQFRDVLPQPVRISGAKLDITASEFGQRLHSQLPPTRLWGYGRSYPGPTIEAVRGRAVRVTWRNELRAPRLLQSLPVDQTIHWADPLRSNGHVGAHARSSPALRRRYSGPIPLVTHLHGAETDPVSDGHPDAWATARFGLKGPAWAREWCEYPNLQPGATLWYHDHTLGITRLTVFAGLAGFYLLREPELERSLNLPSGDYEREILIQDRSFDVHGQLRYPQFGVDPDEHPFWVPEFFGDTLVVNGRVWPYMNVEPRRYRLRLLNGSSSRFYRLALSDKRPFIQIGTDGGFMSVPVEVDKLTLVPGERADVIVDFTGLKPHSTILVLNDAPTPFPKGEAPDPETTGRVMQFRVVPLTGSDASTIPQQLVETPVLPQPTVTRTLTLNEHGGERGPHMALLDGKRWMDPVSETPKLGSTEVWEFVNLTEDAHPIHLHLVQFQVLGRQMFRSKAMASQPRERREPLAAYLSGPVQPPDPNERGWKDTVRADPHEVTRIQMRFAAADGSGFAFDATGKPGYVWHCHILEHEDNEMMRPYTVLA